MFAKDFIFNGQKASDFGLTIGCIDSDEIETSGGTIEYNTVKSPSRDKFLTFGGQFNEVLEWKFTLVKIPCSENSKEPFTQYEESAIAHWLLTPTTGYHWLQFDQDMYQDIWYHVICQMTPHYIYGKTYGYDIVVTSDCGYGWSEEIVKKATLTKNDPFTFVVHSDVETYIYPEITLKNIDYDIGFDVKLQGDIVLSDYVQDGDYISWELDPNFSLYSKINFILPDDYNPNKFASFLLLDYGTHLVPIYIRDSDGTTRNLYVSELNENNIYEVSDGAGGEYYTNYLKNCYRAEIINDEGIIYKDNYFSSAYTLGEANYLNASHNIQYGDITIYTIDSYIFNKLANTEDEVIISFDNIKKKYSKYNIFFDAGHSFPLNLYLNDKQVTCGQLSTDNYYKIKSLWYDDPELPNTRYFIPTIIETIPKTEIVEKVKIYPFHISNDSDTLQCFANQKSSNFDGFDTTSVITINSSDEIITGINSPTDFNYYYPRLVNGVNQITTNADCVNMTIKYREPRRIIV